MDLVEKHEAPSPEWGRPTDEAGAPRRENEDQWSNGKKNWLFRVYRSYGKWWYPWDGTLNNQLHIHLIVRIYWVYPLLKGSLGVEQLGYHPRGTTIFPMNRGLYYPVMWRIILNHYKDPY